jgi:ABC-type glycerol-3-phosphate transport system substrate-binding protein
MLDDQFDFARALTELDGTTMGVLYQADLNHLVFDTIDVEEAPVDWRAVYSSTVPFVFSPAAPADGVNDVILIQYLALGGKLLNSADQPALDAETLTQALEFFQQARETGTVPRSVLDLTDATTAWATYRIGEAGMVQVPASLYLAERAGLSNAGFAAMPLSVQGVATVGHGWALALVTQEPARQQQAVALMEYLLSPENSGAWTRSARRLPTRNAAFDAWDPDDEYLPFVRNLLVHAEPAPNPDLAAAVGGPLSQALTEVLSGRMTPAVAAQAAVEAVQAGQ